MPYKAKLKIDGLKEYELDHVSYGLSRDVDSSGQPSAKVRSGQFSVDLRSDANNEFLNWLATPSKRRNGKITFYHDNEEEKELKTIDFKNGAIISYNESFSNVGSEPMSISMTMTSESIKVNDAEFANSWIKA